ncbi:MAG: dihydrodipicolinate reductase C-terminal domain-containing protein, partial [Candidatus Korobacteraceae bacterium]
MSKASLNLVVLGPGKTGSLVAEVARERGHQVRTVDYDENKNGAWLTPEHLRDFDVAIDFTGPDAVLANMQAVIRARKAMIVGTTGWYAEMERIRFAVKEARTGFVFGANFSYGVNLFFQIVQAAAPALTHGYSGHITELHHIHKKDAPSG